jgi:hypothetical protein
MPNSKYARRCYVSTVAFQYYLINMPDPRLTRLSETERVKLEQEKALHVGLKREAAINKGAPATPAELNRRRVFEEMRQEAKRHANDVASDKKSK